MDRTDITGTLRPLLALLLALFLALGVFPIPVRATTVTLEDLDPGQTVYDLAGVLDEDDLAALTEMISVYDAETGLPMRILLADFIENPQEAEDYLGEMCDYYSGATLMLDTGTDDVYVAAYGDWLTQEAVQLVYDDVSAALAEEGYDSACQMFVQQTRGLVTGIIPTPPPADGGEEGYTIGGEPWSYQVVYDEDQLFSADEAERLTQKAQTLAGELSTPFVIHTNYVDPSADLIEYSKNYYLDNLQGVSPNAVMLTMNPSDRHFRIDAYELTMNVLTDSECEGIVSDMIPYMQDDDYYGAASLFLDEAADLLRQKEQLLQDRLAIENMEVPPEDPALLVYDYAGVFDEAQLESQRALARAFSDELDVDLLLVIHPDLPMGSLAIYSQRFLENHLAAGGRPDSAILVLNEAHEVLHTEGAGLFEDKYEDAHRQDDQYVRYTVEDLLDEFCTWARRVTLLSRLEVPAVDGENWLLDQAGLFSTEETAHLLDAIQTYKDTHKRDVLIVTDELSDPLVADEYLSRLYHSWSDFSSSPYALILLIDKNSELSFIDMSGAVLRRKPYDFLSDVELACTELVQEGRFYDAAFHGLDETDKALNTFIPDYRVISQLGQILVFSLLVGAVMGGVLILILVLVHRGLRTKAPKASRYLSSHEPALSYQSDVFLHSHVTQSRRSKDNSSSGGGSTSSGGSSISSGASGRY